LAAVLLASVLLIAACGLIYELVAGALASYLLGDSVTQFSTVIGTYLFAMGVGSWLSRHIGRGLVTRFVTVELLVAVVGGFSAGALFLAFAYTTAFRVLLYALVTAIGVLVGLEIPLLMRILRDRFTFKDVVSNVLTFDYFGALGASIVFPLLLVPHLGLVRSSLLFGLINVGVALWSTALFRRELGAPRLLAGAGVAVLALLAAGMAGANRITSLAEDNLYADEIILARSSRYQRIVLTAWKDDLRLYLNGHLQFSSRDEHRYHEALVHPGLAAVPGARRVLILGGGDGLAAREALRYPGIEGVTVVDLDPVMTELFATHPLLTRINGGALTSPRVRIVNADAFVWLDGDADRYDFVIADFPDPSSYSLGKLYTTAFYRLVAQHLSRGGLMVVQSTSPMFAPRSFWCITRTIGEAGLQTYPYHAYVPSFGEWGFVLAGARGYQPPNALPEGLRFLTPVTLARLFEFPRDMPSIAVEANHLNNQVLVRYYDEEWSTINR
jgi:spermidine synthase